MSFAFFFALDVFFDSVTNVSQRDDEYKDAIGNEFFRCLRKPVRSEERVVYARVGESDKENGV
jgi:hemerythrin superfamily protein